LSGVELDLHHLVARRPERPEAEHIAAPAASGGDVVAGISVSARDLEIRGRKQRRGAVWFVVGARRSGRSGLGLVWTTTEKRRQSKVSCAKLRMGNLGLLAFWTLVALFQPLCKLRMDT
jgi:hypothetical protein